MAPSDSTVDLDEHFERDRRELDGSQKSVKALGDLSTVIGGLQPAIDVGALRQELDDTRSMVGELREDILNEMESVVTHARALEIITDIRRSLEDILEPDVAKRQLRCRVQGCDGKVDRGDRWCAGCKVKMRAKLR